MAAPDYIVVDVDLATPRDAVRIVDVGISYDAVSVLAIPPGAVVSLHFGTNRQGVPLFGTGSSFDVRGVVDGCAVPANEGLFVTNPAAAGILRLLVSLGASGLAVST